MADVRTHVKERTSAPEGFFETEAAGLRWLGEATASGGADLVEVLDVDSRSLTLAHVESASPNAEAAHAFGKALAATHAAGAPGFGALPPGAGHYYFGPLDTPISLPTDVYNDFGTFYSRARLHPLAERVDLPGRETRLLDDLCRALENGAAEFGRSAVTPARVHGDLWSGNVMWSPNGVVLIDPAACGHHPLADLAMLMMFGAPHVEEIVAGYEAARPLRSGWRQEIPLHQLFGYLVHLDLFGGAYLSPTTDALRASAELCGV